MFSSKKEKKNQHKNKGHLCQVDRLLGVVLVMESLVTFVGSTWCRISVEKCELKRFGLSSTTREEKMRAPDWRLCRSLSGGLQLEDRAG